MRYAYHFEFCERPEMPNWIRNDMLLSLAWVQEVFGLQKIFKENVPEFLKESGSRRLIELGSGSGDGLARIAGVAPRSLPLMATDKYPNPDLWRIRLGHYSQVEWSEEAVGFEDFDRKLGAVALEGSTLLLSTAFHHVPQKDARDFLTRAAQAKANLLIIEPLERRWSSLVLGAAAGLAALVTPLFVRELSLFRRLRLLALHTLFPVIPLLLAHDGVVSAFRQRRSEEWACLLKGLPYRLTVRKGLGLFGNFSVTALTYNLAALNEFVLASSFA